MTSSRPRRNEDADACSSLLEDDLRAGFAAMRRRKQEVLADQQSRWAEGKPASPEELLAHWPADPRDDADVASVLLEDLLQRRSHGEAASLDDYSQRFPEHRRALEGLLSRQEFLRSVGAENSSPPSRLRFPAAGDAVFGFLLREELGKGAFARVFRAEQSELGGRSVAVKISAIAGSEPQTLAQMQHTHIVPIYSVQEDPSIGLRAVCMPYFGGANLACVLQQLGAETKLPMHGRQFVAALEKIQSAAPSRGGDPKPALAQAPAQALVPMPSNGADTPTVVIPTTPASIPGPPPAASESPVPPPGDGQTPLALLRGESYVRAVVWIVARLAEGLQHAHQRRVLHRDIKPANVLVGADGQPMLLDFNLSQDQNQDVARAILGGTVAYMAPEHLRAIARRTTVLLGQVDHRADIYSLGMVLYEMLTGHKPFEQSGSYSVLPLQIEAMAAERGRSAPSLRSQRPDAPWSLESIVRKCLAPDPVDRYQQAEHLAEDLRRQFDHLPLRHAPELSRRERAAKWARRHPRLTSAGTASVIAGLLLLAIGCALVSAREHLLGTTEKLGAAQAQERQRHFEAGAVRALCLVNTTTGLQDHIPQGIKACEETLALYGVLSTEAWREPADWLRLPAEDRARLADDARELLLLLASARAHLAPKDPVVLRQALALLDRAETIPGLAPSRAVWLDRARCLGLLGETKQARLAQRRAEEIPVASARDHYLLATALARCGAPGDCAQALAALDRAIVLDPRHYWAWMQRGICHAEMGEQVLAAGDFGRCTGLWPDFAWGYFNLGYVQARSGAKSEAVRSYTRALECDPALVPALANRGLARLELKRYPEALADLDRALALGKNDAPLHAGRGVALEALGRHPEADAAFQGAFAQADTLSPSLRSQMRAAFGFAVASRLPGKARGAFGQVLQDDPRNIQAMYGSAMLAMTEARNAEALQFFTQALEVAPNFFDARRYRAVLLARKGSLELAREDINWCLEKEPHSGPSLYAAACVASLAAKMLGDPKLADQSLDLLAKALARGVGFDKADTDPDLLGIRDDPRFEKLLVHDQRK